MKEIQISQPLLGEAEWQAMREPIFSGWLTQGPKVKAFERAFSERHAVKHSLAATSCTTALHLILAAMGIGPGDEVIVPAFTWVATANVVVYCGATPVFVDVDQETFNLDVRKLAAKITKKTKAIIAVHLFGQCADMDAIGDVAKGIPVIEDAACAAGSGYKGRPAGSLGYAAAFSFHPRKSITTGEGGMVTTNDDKLADVCNMLRNHGASISEEQRHLGPKPYLLPEFNLLGFNYRMTDLQGAVGLEQLTKLDKFIDERQTWASFYDEQLRGIPWLKTPFVPDRKANRHGWQAYVTTVDPTKAPRPRNDLMDALFKKGINTRPGTHAVTMLGYYKERFGINPADYPGAHWCNEQTMAIPLHNRMTPDDYKYVVQAIKDLG